MDCIVNMSFSKTRFIFSIVQFILLELCGPPSPDPNFEKNKNLSYTLSIFPLWRILIFSLDQLEERDPIPTLNKVGPP